MTTAQDILSMQRMWSALESRYRNRCQYFSKHVSVDQLKRIDEQLHIALYALATACPGTALAEANIPKPRFTRAAFVFSHTAVNAIRDKGAGFAAYAALLAEQGRVFASPVLLQAVIEALLFIPAAVQKECIEQLGTALNPEQARLLMQWLGCYLPTTVRRRFLAEEDDLLSAIAQGAKHEQLLARFDALLAVLPHGAELLWLSLSDLPQSELVSILESDPEVGFNLLAIVDDEQTLALIVDGLKQPQTNPLAYQAWLLRTGLVLPQVSLLQDTTNPGKTAGPLLADAEVAAQWLQQMQQQTPEQKQLLAQQQQQRLQQRVSLLDDGLWLRQGGLAKTGHLLRLHPYQNRQGWCSTVVDDNDDKEANNGH
jgi:hypothetical protein